MNARNSYGFQQLVELCKQTHQEIPQTMSAESEVKVDYFPSNNLKEAKDGLDLQACAYHPSLTEDEISQQSADQLLRFHINPVEFDGIRMQADMWDSKPGPEDKS
jgi:hypothetical protein